MQHNAGVYGHFRHCSSPPLAECLKLVRPHHFGPRLFFHGYFGLLGDDTQWVSPTAPPSTRFTILYLSRYKHQSFRPISCCHSQNLSLSALCPSLSASQSTGTSPSTSHFFSKESTHWGPTVQGPIVWGPTIRGSIPLEPFFLTATFPIFSGARGAFTP